MTLLQIQYFESICRCRSTMKAAEDMNISQSTISLAIKKLEEELQVTLFVRSNKGLEPTAAGQALLKHAKIIINDINQAEQELKEYAETTVLSLGISSMIGVSLLPKIYTFLHQEQAHLTLDVTNVKRNIAIEMIQNGKLDAYIGTIASPEQYQSLDDFRMLKLGTAPSLVFCISLKNPLASNPDITFPDLLSIPLVRLANSGTSHIDNVYQKYGKTPVILQTCSQISSMISMISSNLAAGFFNQDIVEQYSGIRIFPVPDLKPANYYLLCKNSTKNKKALRYFLQLMKKFSESADCS